MENIDQTRKQLWGELSDIEIEAQIQQIETMAQKWNEEVNGVVFLFTMNNSYRWICSQYYTTNRKLVVNGDAPSVIDSVQSFNPNTNVLTEQVFLNYSSHDRNLPLLLLNGSIVLVDLLTNLDPFKRGKPCVGIASAFQSSLPDLELSYSLMANNSMEADDSSKLGDLPIAPSKAFIIPTQELNKLKEMVHTYFGSVQVTLAENNIKTKTGVDSVYADLLGSLVQYDDIWEIVKAHRTLTTENINPATQLIRIVRAIAQSNTEMSFFDYAEALQDMRNQTRTPSYENLSVAKAYAQLSSVCQEFVDTNGRLIPLTSRDGRIAARDSNTNVQRLSRREITVLNMEVEKTQLPT